VIKDAILDGAIQNDRKQAWQLMLETGQKLGATPVITEDKAREQGQEQGQ